jgi:hypothetical protein
MSLSTVEERLSILESEVNQLKLSLVVNTPEKPYWEGIVGIFADDPTFTEAIAIGREYRQSWQDSFQRNDGFKNCGDRYF